MQDSKLGLHTCMTETCKSTSLGKPYSLGESDIDRAKMYLYEGYVQQWRGNINDTVVNPKLRTYYTFKDPFTMEPYLLHICDFNLRRVLSRFRLSCHDLEIEKGQHWGFPQEQRFC